MERGVSRSMCMEEFEDLGIGKSSEEVLDKDNAGTKGGASEGCRELTRVRSCPSDSES